MLAINQQKTPLEPYLFFLGIFLFTIGLIQFGSCHGLGLEGSRFILSAQEMLRNGFTSFPTVYGQLYPDYIVTQTFLIYLFSLLVGKITTVTAVLPSALASTLTLILTYRIGAIHSKLWGIAAVLLELATFQFFILARAPSLDQFVATATIFCFYLVYTAKLYNNYKKLFWLPLGLIGGFLFRGPIGLIIPASVIGIFYLLNKDYKRLGLMIILNFVLLSLCTLGLLLLAYYTGGTTLLKSIWNLEIIGRIHDTTVHYIISYYLTAGLTSYFPSFPLAIIVLIALRKTIFTRSTNQVTFLLQCLAAWFLIILIGLSIPVTKHARYIVALTPAAALIASYPFVYTTQQAFLNQIKNWILQGCKFLPWFGLSLSSIGLIYNQISQQPFDASFKTAIVCYLLLIVVMKKYIQSKWFSPQIQVQKLYQFPLKPLVVGTATLLILYINIITPITAQFNSLRPLASKVLPWLTPKMQIAFYHIGPDGENDDIKLMAQLNLAIKPHFFSTPTEIDQIKKPTLIFIQEPFFSKLPLATRQQLKILFSGKVDKEMWMILSNRPLIFPHPGSLPQP